MNLLEKLQAMDALNGGPANAPPAPAAPAPVTSGAFAPGGAFAGTDAAAAVAARAGGVTTNFSPAFLAQPDGGPGTSEPTEPVAAEPNAVNPPKRGRGRPRKAAAPAETPAQQIAAAAAEIQPPPVNTTGANPAPDAPKLEIKITGPAPAPTPAPAAAHRISTLYVGCVPRGSDESAADFDALVAKCKVAIGPATYYAKYGYQANGLLLQMMESVLQHDKPEAVVVTYPNAPEATLCLSHLRSISDTVVEAVR